MRSQLKQGRGASEVQAGNNFVCIPERGLAHMMQVGSGSVSTHHTDAGRVVQVWEKELLICAIRDDDQSKDDSCRSCRSRATASLQSLYGQSELPELAFSATIARTRNEFQSHAGVVAIVK
eukprot:scaffold131014_cov15-Tisochrysis_lutea.AAC.1